MKRNITLTIIGLIIFGVGFFAGMEYKAYQVGLALKNAFSGATSATPENKIENAVKTEDTVMKQAEKENMKTIQKIIGDEVTLSSLSLKVTSVEEKQVISSGYGSPKTAAQGSKFIVIGMDVTNITKSVFTFYPDDGFILVDDKGREYKTYENTIGSIDNYLNAKELSPSIKEAGLLVYELPTDAIKYALVTSKAGSSELYKIVLK